jgi:hypothetical protein
MDRKVTLLKLFTMIETARGSSTKEVLMILPIPSCQGISLIIFRVIGLEEMSKMLS